jgi:tetratricopeptide (TPR) repeat protein
VLVGWLWFVVTLIPVIGIVPVGAHVRADRYTYIPLIGLFIAVVWSLYEMALQKRGRKTGLATAALAALAVLGVLARMQAGYWRSAETLYAHALEVTRDNYLIHNNMATTLLEQGRFDEALTNLSAATRINPLYQPAQFNLGFILLLRGQTEDAIEHLSAAVRLDPNDVDSRTVLADALSRAGRHGEAVAHYGAAVRLEPENPGLHTNLGNELARLGNYEQAVSHYREALRLRPGDALAHYNLGLALEQQGLPAP